MSSPSNNNGGHNATRGAGTTPQGAGKRSKNYPTDCTTVCCLDLHYDKAAALVASNWPAEEILRKLPLTCANVYEHTSEAGFNLLHVAARHGHSNVLSELLKHLQSSSRLNAADKGSRYTPLHLAIFTGQLHCAAQLHECGADMHAKDGEGFSPHLLARVDRRDFNHQPHQSHLSLGRTDLMPRVTPMTWGLNGNDLLGHADPRRRLCPDSLPPLQGKRVPAGNASSKDHCILPKAALSKFHMMLVTSGGEVFTCGHGRGGRLGHGTEQSELTPRLVESLKGSAIHLVAAGQTHSVFVSMNNTLFTCGSNEHGQLGLPNQHSNKQVKCALNPRRVHFKAGYTIVGVAASRYHTAVVTSSSLLVCGTDRGQFGRTKSSTNTLLSSFSPVHLTHAQQEKKFSMLEVAASNDVTACLCKAQCYEDKLLTGHEYLVFVCMGHTVQVISSRDEISQLNLWTRLSVSALNEDGDGKHKKSEAKVRAKETAVLCLSESNQIMSWASGTDNSFRKCPLKTSLPAGKITKLVTTCKLAVVTSLGEVYVGVPERQQAVNPNKRVLEERRESVSDLISKATFLATCSHFKPLVVKRVPEIDQAASVAMDPKGENFVSLLNVPCISMQPLMSELPQQVGNAAETLADFHDIVFQTKDGESVHSWRYFLVSHDPTVLRNHLPSIGTLQQSGVMLVKATEKFTSQTVGQLLLALCTSWRSVGLLSDTEKVDAGQEGVEVTHDMSRCYHVLFGRNMPRSGKRNWKRQQCKELYDIVIKTTDGALINAHRCILVMRSVDFFCPMLQSGWKESMNGAGPVLMDSDSGVLSVVLDYLYEDCLNVQDSWTEEFLCKVLALADQLLLLPLKSLCEYHLVSYIDFRNVAELLPISQYVGAEQLCQACCEFICFYLPLLLETKFLNGLSENCLQAVSDYYRSKLPAHRTPPAIDQAELVNGCKSDANADMFVDEQVEHIDYVVTGNVSRSRQNTLVTENNSELDLQHQVAALSLANGSDGAASASPASSDADADGDGSGIDDVDMLPEDDSYGCGSDYGYSSLDQSSRSQTWTEGDVTVVSVSQCSPTVHTPRSASTTAANLSGLSTPSSHYSLGFPSSAGSWPYSDRSRASGASLSDIMQQQSRESPVTPSPSSSGSKSKPAPQPSSKPIDIGSSSSSSAKRGFSKLSQSQRKQMEREQRALAERGAAPLSAGTSSAPETPAWGAAPAETAAKSQPCAPSLHDIITQQELQTPPGQPKTTPVSSSSSGKKSRSRDKARPRKLTWDEFADHVDASKSPPSHSVSKSNPWNIPASSSPNNAWTVASPLSTPANPIACSPSFKEIMAAEQDPSLLVKSAGKPLATIQLEDTAIDELTKHYWTFFEEKVKVTRVPSTKVSAPPTWQCRAAV